jgi:hypothetical protein
MPLPGLCNGAQPFRIAEEVEIVECLILTRLRKAFVPDEAAQDFQPCLLNLLPPYICGEGHFINQHS